MTQIARTTPGIAPDVDPNLAPYTDRGYFGPDVDPGTIDADPNTAPYTNSDALANADRPMVMSNTERPPLSAADQPVIINDGDDSNMQPKRGFDGTSGHDPAKGATLGGVGGAIIGGFAGGPVGAVIGAVAGAAVSGAAVAGVDLVDDDKSPGEMPERLPGETPGEYTDRIVTEQNIREER